MRVSHHLDLLLVSEHAHCPEPAILSHWQQEGILAGRKAGPAAHRLIEGGFSGLRVDRPEQRMFYSNQQGGFRVQCPDCGQHLVGPFSQALTGWRRGGPFELDCPGCGGHHALSALRFNPVAAFGYWALILHDAETARLGPEGLAALERWSLTPVWRRRS